MTPEDETFLRGDAAAFHEVIERRSKAIESLLKSLEHLPRERQFAILTSWYDLDQLEKIAEFQDREN